MDDAEFSSMIPTGLVPMSSGTSTVSETPDFMGTDSTLALTHLLRGKHANVKIQIYKNDGRIEATFPFPITKTHVA